MHRGRQVEYLRAMGIEVWWRRGNGIPVGSRAATQPNVSPTSAMTPDRGYVIGPGSGSLLLLCDSAGDAALPIAADIARCFADAPVWGWPAPAGGAAGMALDQAIRERLFTGVLVFGALPETPAAAGCSPVWGSARIVHANALADLARSPEARRALWERLRSTDWCVPRSRTASGE